MHIEQRLLQHVESLKGHVLNGSNPHLHAVRAEGAQRFEALGIPRAKSEAWKYTLIEREMDRNWTPVLTADPASVSQADINGALVPDLDAYVAVLLNGRFVRELSRLEGLPKGVTVSGFQEAEGSTRELLNARLGTCIRKGGDAFTALNSAYLADGLFVHVAKSVTADKPILALSFVSADVEALVQPRVLFVTEENGEAQLIERVRFLTSKPVFVNTVTEAFAGKHSRVQHYRLQENADDAREVSATEVYQEEHSNFSTLTVSLSGALIRNNIYILPDGEFCESHMRGLFLTDGSMHVDNATFMDHAKPNCFSNEAYKGVLSGSSRGVFNGKVLVRRDAQKTNAYQSSRSIILSDGAEMNSKPELEIYADDVKCSHGAATGRLDADAMFYLKARGLSEVKARALLLLAFARDVAEGIDIEPLRAYVDDRLQDRFHTSD